MTSNNYFTDLLLSFYEIIPSNLMISFSCHLLVKENQILRNCHLLVLVDDLHALCLNSVDGDDLMKLMMAVALYLVVKRQYFLHVNLHWCLGIFDVVEVAAVVNLPQLHKLKYKLKLIFTHIQIHKR